MFIRLISCLGLHFASASVYELKEIELFPQVSVGSGERAPGNSVNKWNDCQSKPQSKVSVDSTHSGDSTDAGCVGVEMPESSTPKGFLSRMFSFAPKTTTKKLTVHFIRHAESIWNEESTGLKKAQLETVGAFSTEDKDKLTDAGLSLTGIESVLQLAEKQLETECSQTIECLDEEEKQFLMGLSADTAQPARKTVFATSNLRRAIMTLLILFKNRIAEKSLEKVHILSSLQEMTGNIDSTPITPPKTAPLLSWSSSEADQCPLNQATIDLFDASCNLRDENSGFGRSFYRDRLGDFCKWARYQGLDNQATDLVIVGHSIWIRNFFAKYRGGNFFTNLVDFGNEAALGSSFTKLGNKAIIKFELELTDDGSCAIAKESLKFMSGHIEKRIAGAETMFAIVKEHAPAVKEMKKHEKAEKDKRKSPEEIQVSD